MAVAPNPIVHSSQLSTCLPWGSANRARGRRGSSVGGAILGEVPPPPNGTYPPAKLARCKKTCGLCESPPSAPPPAPPSPPPCEDTDKKCIPKKCKSYDPVKLAKCKKTCNLCDPSPPPPPPPPKDDCDGFVDNNKCRIKKKKCNKNPPATMKKCKKLCKKDRKKKKRLCKKTCCELGFRVI